MRLYPEHDATGTAAAYDCPICDWTGDYPRTVVGTSALLVCPRCGATWDGDPPDPSTDAEV